MTKLLKKTGVMFLTAFIVWSFSPMAFAIGTETPVTESEESDAVNQAGTSSPLDDIKEKLEGEDIEVIDFSTNKWGKLPDRVIKALEDAHYDGLAEMYQELDVLVEGALSNQEKLDEAIEILKDDLSAVEYEYVNDEGDNDTAPLSGDDIDLIVSEVLAYQYAGERQMRDIVMSVVNTARNIIGGIAILWIVISGIRMAFAGGDETTITEQKRSIFYTVIGLVAILLIERLIDILYGPLGEVRTTLDVTTTTKFSMEVLGLVSFIKAIFGTLAILMMVISGIKIIFAMGEEEKIKKQKQALFWIVIGFLLILINKVVIENIFIQPIKSLENPDQIQASNITTVINLLGTVIQFALGFVGLVALGALIYGAGTMVANYGNDEVVQKSKKIIKNAIIGIIVIISAYTVVATLIVFK